MADNKGQNNIGLDFGTTYSLISELTDQQYDKDGNLTSYKVEEWSPTEASSAFQDSVVVQDSDGQFLCGRTTRTYVGRPRVKVYKGFKMLLGESKDSQLLSNYTDNSPEDITKTYLNSLLQGYCKNKKKGELCEIDNLVIGVPEVWDDDLRTVDKRGILKDIIDSLDYVKNCEIKTEPEAACAYFLDNYKHKTESLYEGYILIVDYGGGTLDIALCDVTVKDNTNEVAVIKRCGAGINEEGRVGKAGMAFIEESVLYALRQTGKSDEEIRNHRHFYRCVNNLEEILMSNEGTERIEETFEGEILSDLTEIEDKFAEVEFDDELYIVTYGMLAKAYETVIYGALDSKLDEIRDYMDKKGIRYGSSGDSIKIATVGGFCNFYLTTNQIYEKFVKGGDKDKRFLDILNDKRDCEKAISYGCALISNRLVKYKPIAPYTIGFGQGDETELVDYWTVFDKGEEIVYDQPSFVKNSDGTPTIFLGGGIKVLVFSKDDFVDINTIKFAKPLKKYIEKMKLNEDKYYYLGMCYDKNKIIYLCTQELDGDYLPIGAPNKIRLDDLWTMFGGVQKIN